MALSSDGGLLLGDHLTDGALLAGGQTGFGTSGSNSGQSFLSVARCGNGSLGSQNLVTGSAILSFRLTLGGAGGCDCLFLGLRMSGGGKGLSFCKNQTAGVALHRGDLSRSGASGSHRLSHSAILMVGHATVITEEDLEYAMNKIMRPTAAAMVEEGCSFCGVLYGGLMKTKNGIKVIEFNARFGDPETEVILPRMTSDICQVFCDIVDGKQPTITWNEMATLGIVLASKGYPGDYAKGFAIRGTEKVDGTVFHMGTAVKDGELVTAGGRVLFVVAKGATLADAHKKANEEVSKIECENLFHRTDIGHKAFK